MLDHNYCAALFLRCELEKEIDKLTAESICYYIQRTNNQGIQDTHYEKKVVA